MSLRLKILALASLLLLAFAVTTALSAKLIARVMDEMAGTVEYHIPLTAVISEIDVLTFEYELNLRRLIDRGARDPNQLRDTVARQKVVGNRLREVVAAAHPLLEKAVHDERNDVSDRLQFARLEGLLEQLSERVEPFLALGGTVQAAIEQRHIDEAVRLADGFAEYERAFGSDLARVRESITSLTRDSMDETRGQSASIRWINVGLFAAASTVGLGLVALLGYRLQGAFQRLPPPKGGWHLQRKGASHLLLLARLMEALGSCHVLHASALTSCRNTSSTAVTIVPGFFTAPTTTLGLSVRSRLPGSEQSSVLCPSA